MILSFLAGTFSILGTQLVLAAAFAGIGLAVRRLYGLKAVGLDDCFMAFWMGFSVVILFLMLWNFAFPVSGIVLLLVLVGGTAGLFSARKELRRVFEQGQWRPTYGFVALSFFAALYIANLSLGSLSQWDSSLYHIQGVKWAKSYAIVPGLANLYGPLGFNNTSFLYAAMLDTGPWTGRSNHLANGLLVLVLMTQALAGGARFVGSISRKTTCYLFDFCLLAPVLYGALAGRISSYSTALPMAMVLLAAISKLYSLLNADQTDEPKAEAYGIVCVATLLAVAVSIKMSSAVFAAICLPLIVFIWVRRQPAGEPLVKKTLGWIGVITALIGFTWMARGVVLSGYPFFPYTIAGLPVDWRVPIEHAEAEFAYIVHSSLALSWGYLPNWAKYVLFSASFDVVVPLFAAALAVALYLLTKSQAGTTGQSSGSHAWWMLLPLGGAIAAWLLVAPNPRYASPIFWTLAALCTGQAYYCLQMKSPGSLLRKRVFVWVAFLGIAPPLVYPILQAAKTAVKEGRPVEFNPLRVVMEYNLKKPGSDLWYQPIAGTAKLRTFITSSGLRLNVPAFFRDRHFNRCWDAPLPCTPNPAANLRLRRPGRIEGGFIVDGRWQMQHWPYSWRSGFLREWHKRKSRSAPNEAVEPNGSLPHRETIS